MLFCDNAVKALLELISKHDPVDMRTVKPTGGNFEKYFLHADSGGRDDQISAAAAEVCAGCGVCMQVQ